MLSIIPKYLMPSLVITLPFVILYFSKFRLQVANVLLLLLPWLVWVVVGIHVQPQKSLANLVIEPYFLFLITAISFLVRRFLPQELNPRTVNSMQAVFLSLIALIFQFYIPILPE